MNDNSLKIFVWVVVLSLGVLYITNVYKLFQCDFKSPYKCEVIHGIGVIIPPLSSVSAWFEEE